MTEISGEWGTFVLQSMPPIPPANPNVCPAPRLHHRTHICFLCATEPIFCSARPPTAAAVGSFSPSSLWAHNIPFVFCQSFVVALYFPGNCSSSSSSSNSLISLFFSLSLSAACAFSQRLPTRPSEREKAAAAATAKKSLSIPASRIFFSFLSPAHPGRRWKSKSAKSPTIQQHQTVPSSSWFCIDKTAVGSTVKERERTKSVVRERERER